MRVIAHPTRNVSSHTDLFPSVYVQNLEERVKPEPLTEALEAIFEEFGEIDQIIVKKNIRAKGQAFIAFVDPKDAQAAVDELNGFELFDKPMRLAMAKSRSDKTVERNGTSDELLTHKAQRTAEKGALKSLSSRLMRKTDIYAEKRQAMEAAEEQRNLKRGGIANADTRPNKAIRSAGLKSTSVQNPAVVPDEYLPPNKILFLQNLPEGDDVEGLTAIFGRFEGFREVRLVPGRAGIAFVEYDAEQGAIAAKENTAGMTLGNKTIKVTYQRQ